MPTAYLRIVLLPICFVAAMISLRSESLSQAREKIGELLGQSVYRDQLESTSSPWLPAKLIHIFVSPLIESYSRENEKDFAMSQQELEKALAYFRADHENKLGKNREELVNKLKEVTYKLENLKLSAENRSKLEAERNSIEFQLTAPNEVDVKSIVSYWKFQRHVYDHFGGGRLRWSKPVTVAYDATYRWLQEQEKQGKFKIYDPEIRNMLYANWTDRAFSNIMDPMDKEDLDLFFQPPWSDVGRMEQEDGVPANK